jgi:hypothetical protein
MGKRKISAGFCAGNVMRYLAEGYATVPEVVEEIVQNLIDAKARNAIITINLKSRSIDAFDDGNGASETEFTKRVQKIGKPQKDDLDVGGKGIGNLASIGVMGEGGIWQLTTRPKKRSKATNPHFTASLEFDKLEDADAVDFVFEDKKSNFTFKNFVAPKKMDLSRMVTRVRTTCVEPTALTSLKKHGVEALRDICEELGGKFAAKIKANKAQIHLALVNGKGEFVKTVEPQEFRGLKADPITIDTKSGPVLFEMYTTTIKERKPQIKVRHKAVFDMDLRKMKDIWKEYADVLDSGYIQGYIHLDFCATDTKREVFHWSDELQDFLEAIEKFCDQHARGWLKELNKKLRINRIQEDINDAVVSLDKFLKDNPQFLSDALRGPISSGHKPKKGQKPRKKYRGTNKKRGGKGSVSMGRMGKEKNKVHVASKHDKGSERTLVVGESGVAVDYVEPDPAKEDINWTFKIDKGIVLVNINHKLFKIHSDRGRAVGRLYIRELIRGALSTSSVFSEKGEVQALSFKAYFENYHLPHIEFIGKK